MSLKKTWFSYVLWFLFVAITVISSYVLMLGVLDEFYEALCLHIPRYAFPAFNAIIAAIIVVMVLLIVLVHYLFGKIKVTTLPGWCSIFVHILISTAIIGVFGMFRYQAFMDALGISVNLQPISEQATFYYELAKVEMTAGVDAVSGYGTFFEQVYIYMLRGLFLFLGNRPEIIYFVQLILQAITLILLMLIGHNMQKGIYAWIPSLLYGISPVFFYTAEDVGITNFLFFVVVLGMSVICLFEKIWKKKNITYLAMFFGQLLFAGYIFYINMDVLLYKELPFASYTSMPEVRTLQYTETILLAVLLIVYCVTFFMDKQDHRTLFILSFVVFAVLFVWLSFYPCELFYTMFLVALLNLFFLISQSLHVLFRTKPDVVTGNKVSIPDCFEWDEMKEEIRSTDGIEVREEEPAKTELVLTEILQEDTKEVKDTAIVTESPEVVVPIDRRAPIENVLPMPKKHKPKILEYAFEPAEDMMHFDIELENDEYDY